MAADRLPVSRAPTQSTLGAEQQRQQDRPDFGSPLLAVNSNADQDGSQPPARAGGSSGGSDRSPDQFGRDRDVVLSPGRQEFFASPFLRPGPDFGAEVNFNVIFCT